MDYEALLRLFDAIIAGLEHSCGGHNTISFDHLEAIRKARQDFEDGSKPPLDQSLMDRRSGWGRR